jgi:hypothetical protein
MRDASGVNEGWILVVKTRNSERRVRCGINLNQKPAEPIAVDEFTTTEPKRLEATSCRHLEARSAQRELVDIDL